MKFTRSFKTELSIEFSDAEKAEKFFIDSDWSEFFFSSSDMEDFSEILLEQFINSQHGSIYVKGKVVGRGKDIEGYNHFLSNFDCDEYKSSSDEYGDIIIKVEENNYRDF